MNYFTNEWFNWLVSNYSMFLFVVLPSALAFGPGLLPESRRHDSSGRADG